MLNFLFIFFGITALVLVLLFLFLNSSPARLRRIFAWALGFILLGIVVFFLYRTNGSFLWTFLFVLLPLFMRIKGILSQIRNFAKTARGPSEGQSSSVQTEFLEMTLEHDSGKMTGIVKKGRFSGNRLEKLNLDELVHLLEEARDDPKTIQLLENFLEINHGAEWRTRESSHKNTSNSLEMDIDQALEILGLDPNPAKSQIIDAHRKLILANHPDRGGSTFLASQINKAKEVLLQNV